MQKGFQGYANNLESATLGSSNQDGERLLFLFVLQLRATAKVAKSPFTPSLTFLRGVFVVMSLGLSLRSERAKSFVKLILKTVQRTH